MKILVLNWRDIKHPAAGGAEVVTFEVAKRWVLLGHEVTWFVAEFPNSLSEETIDGVRIIRRGKQFSVHFEAFKWYRSGWRGYFDVVVDEINTIPFFTPLYVKEKKVALIHQLAREVWFYEARFPINVFGYLLEPFYLRFYQKTPTMTISESTQKHLKDLGVKSVNVIHCGFNGNPLPEIPKPGEKAKRPTVLYVGRVVPSKRVTDLIKSIGLVSKRIPDVQLCVAGAVTPAYLKHLEGLVKKYQIENNICILGKVSFEERQALMKQASLLAMASVREGWGLVVIEANAFGTPAVVYNVPGLCDSVQHNRTGWVCSENTPESMADAITNLLLNDDLRNTMAKNALEWSRTFTWETNAVNILDVLQRVNNGEL